MTIRYKVGVNTKAGWRSVEVTAEAVKVSPRMLEVIDVQALGGESPARVMSVTGSRRQEFNGLYFAGREIGARKRLSCVELV